MVWCRCFFPRRPLSCRNHARASAQHTPRFYGFNLARLRCRLLSSFRADICYPASSSICEGKTDLCLCQITIFGHNHGRQGMSLIRRKGFAPIHREKEGNKTWNKAPQSTATLLRPSRAWTIAKGPLQRSNPDSIGVPKCAPIPLITLNWRIRKDLRPERPPLRIDCRENLILRIFSFHHIRK